MDDYDLYQLERYRRKTIGIIAKVLVTIVIMKIANEKSSNPFVHIYGAAMFYSFVSVCAVTVDLTRNWLIGIVVGVVAVILAISKIGDVFGEYSQIAAAVIPFLAAVIDVVTIVRFLTMNGRIKKQSRMNARMNREPVEEYEVSLKETNFDEE